MTPHVNHFRGSLLGLALGDALGAPREGGPLERLLWRLIGTTADGRRRFTDDTQMSLDLAESLVERGALDPDDVALRFARGYRWSRGYGPGAARVLKRIRAGQHWSEANRAVYPGGSFGNGAAMRAPVIGLFFSPRTEHLADAARRSAEVTHAHPLAVEGAMLVATATAAALTAKDGAGIFDGAARALASEELIERARWARRWMVDGAAPTPGDVRARLGMGITAAESCVTAIYLAARYVDEPLSAMLAFIASCGGDVDTVGAMAGAIWGARNGVARIPPEDLAVIEDGPRIDAIAIALHRRALAASGPPGA